MRCASSKGLAQIRRYRASADATASTLYIWPLKESDSNRFYVRLGFQLVESGEFDNYYL
ncbi:hypothetical protein ALO75_04013, partial [Pseudomonas syringae pv. coryli]